jgi:hypothetical protein
MRVSPALLEADLVSSAQEPSRIAGSGPRAGLFEWTTLGIFTTLLALLTWRHEMWRDELQAWLIARDSHSLRQLFHALHYEGHPSLWYLLLWIPAHLSPNPASMQVINGIFAVVLAWIVLSTMVLPRSMRVLIVFSFFVFYQFGVEARSYELGFLLLVAAARCLMGKRQHRKLAILLLALSINTHVFAAPVAVALATWAFGCAKLKTWRDAGRLLRDGEFLTAFVVLGAAGILALITVWPARDLASLDSALPTISSNFQFSAGRVWLTWVPRLPRPAQMMLTPIRDSIPASCVLSLAGLAFVAMLLRTTAARTFFLSCALMEVAAISLTVGTPSIYHLGFIFAALVIALMLDHSLEPYANPHRLWLSRKINSASLFLLLLPQVLSTADASVLDWMRPFSDAKEASQWLKANHLDRNPLVLQPSESTTGIVAYLERPNAYYPSCRCFGSYEIRDTARQEGRMATSDELRMVRGDSALPVILISNEALKPDYLRTLGLVEIHSTAQKSEEDDEIFYIYQQVHPQ